MKAEISGMIAVDPQGGKISRAHAVSGEVEAHNVYLPAERNAQGILVPLHWVHDFIEEHAAFPSGTHDDDVDSCTQALAQIRKLNMSMGLVEYMKQQSEKMKEGIAKVVTTTLQKPVTDENTERCPACQATTISRVGSQKRCNQCGTQFGGKVPQPSGMPRRTFTK